jgi:hypothetical protein
MMNLKQLATLPRIIGIILIVIAVLVFKTQAVQAIILGIVGLVLVFTPNKTATKHWNEFIASLRMKKEYALIMLFDAVFWAVLAILAAILVNMMRGQVQQLKTIPLGTGITLANIDAYNAVFANVFATSITTLITFWLLVVIAYSLSRGMIWLTLLEKPVSKAFFIRFSLLNLLWCTSWLALELFVMLTITPVIAAALAIIFALLFIHLTTILHYSYTRMREFKKAIGTAFAIGLGNAQKFIHLYCYLFIAYLILQQAQRFAQGKAGLVVSAIIALAFMAWYRIFMRNTLRSIA